MRKLTHLDDTVSSTIAAASVYSALNVDAIQRLLAKAGMGGTVVFSTGLFVLVFKGLLWLYHVAAWKIVHRNDQLSGSWSYVLTNETTGIRLFGYFTIDHDRSGIRLRAGRVWRWEDHETDANFRGAWTGTFASRSNDRLQFVYTMRAGPGAIDSLPHSGEYRGCIEVGIEGRPATSMHGRFEDLGARTGNQGALSCFRETADVDSRNLRSLLVGRVQ